MNHTVKYDWLMLRRSLSLIVASNLCSFGFVGKTPANAQVETPKQSSSSRNVHARTRNSASNLVLLALDSSSSNGNNVSPENPDANIQLRPSIAPGQASSSDSKTSAKNAQAAIDDDFSRHHSAATAIPKGAPARADSGASGDKTPALLTPRPEDESGPSTVSLKSQTLEDIQLKPPPLQSLISVNSFLNPFQLDANATRNINLRQALGMGLNQNLDLAIVRTNTKQKEYVYYSSLGNFLPDPNFGYSDFIPDGRIGLPNGFASAFTGGVASLGGTNGAADARAGSSGSQTIRIHSPFEFMHGGIDFYAYRGGSVFFGAQQSKHNFRAARYQEKAGLSDMLMTVTQNYYNLILAETLLQIRIQAVRTSEEQLRRNQDRFHSGLATNLDVLQSETQLSTDKQSLVDQQVSRRSAAIALADSLYANLGEDFIPEETLIRKIRLIDPRLNIADILQLAIDHRPELKQYEELRLAARKAIMVSAANLQPTLLLSGSVYGIGPPSNIQALNVFSVNANWRLRGFGTVDAMNVEQARWQARQARLQAQKELQTVLNQVRNSYLQILDKERNIEETSKQCASALEELRLAELRKSHGLGLNLDVITGQRDYTQALVAKAQAIINFNIAQAQLLHDMGLISVDALTGGRLLSKANSK